MYTRRYNIYEAMLRAAAGDGTGGGDPWADAEAEAAKTSNAPTINADDPEEAPPPADDKPAAKADGEAPPPADGDAPPPADGDAPPADSEPEVMPRRQALKRIGELTRAKKELERRLAEAEKAGAKPPEGEPEPSAPQRREFKTEEEFQAAVRREAAQQRELQEFNENCVSADKDGEKRFGAKDWETSLDNLKILSDDGNVPKIILDAAFASDDPAQALHALGKDPELADRVLRMSPVRRVAEIAKLGMKVAAPDPKPAPKPKPKSAAPEPIEPIGGNSGSANDGLGDEVDDETWLANRQKQLSERARMGRG